MANYLRITKYAIRVLIIIIIFSSYIYTIVTIRKTIMKSSLVQSTTTKKIIKPNEEQKIIQISTNNHYYNSSLQSDIINITHYPNEAMIVIYFKNDDDDEKMNIRQCLTPNVRGRLSGPYLSIIEWKEEYQEQTNNSRNRNNNKNNNDNDLHQPLKVISKLIGTYKIPSDQEEKGLYFIEIIGLFCNHHFNDYDYNFKESCMIDPIEHRITANDAFIDVISNNNNSNNNNNNNNSTLYTSERGNEMGVIGYWKWNETSIINTTTLHDNEDEQLIQESMIHENNMKLIGEPLYTRYQPQSCRSVDEIKAQRCKDPIDTSRFEKYNFVFHTTIQSNIETIFNSYTQKEKQLQQQPQQGNNNNNKIQKKKLCIVGWSHTRVMIESMTEILNLYNINKSIFELSWIKARFPHELYHEDFVNLINNSNNNGDQDDSYCTHLLVGVGQWPGYTPMLLNQFQFDMEKAIKALLHVKDEMKFELILRSIQ